LNPLEEEAMPVTKQDQQNEHPKGEVQTESGETLKGPKPSRLPQERRVLSEGAPGEERTPDMPIGQVAHADAHYQVSEKPKDPATSGLEPEKQGGIGGP
jgi:hypothetical protein